MKTTLQARRILLDETAAGHLQKMMATLSEEGSHLRLVHSKVVSWLVTEYATRYFGREKGRMAEALFNRKSFLKAMMGGLKSGTDDEIKQLEATLRELRAGRVGKIAGRQEKEVQPEPDPGAIEAQD